jgi:NADH dehydrogenase
MSYTGSAIAEELLSRGEAVRSLSRRDDPIHPLRARIDFAPLRFDDSLVDSLHGVSTLYNTYWIRFERDGHTFSEAVARSILLFEAARRAGVGRIVHVSVSSADAADDLPYFRGKHQIEEWLASSDLGHSIVRPTLVFGPGDILLNNIAWILRRFPLFLLPGRGDYRVQPVSLRDTARICIDAPPGQTIDAAGPETMSFAELVAGVRDAVESRARLVRAPVALSAPLVRGAGLLLHDVIVTPAELAGLSRSLLISGDEPLGSDRFTDWVGAHGASLGRRYVSELARNFRGQE